MLPIEGYLTDLKKVAPEMRQITQSDRPSVRYELLSDSLVWSDELPKAAEVSIHCLRFVFRYRTGLILGEPDKAYEAFWTEAKRRFPEWVGFAPERTARNRELAEFFAREKQLALQAANAALEY